MRDFSLVSADQNESWELVDRWIDRAEPRLKRLDFMGAERVELDVKYG